MRIMLATAALCLAAGTAAADTRPLANFDKVSASAGTQVEITIGPSFQVSVEGRDAARIVTRVAGDTLVVEPERSVGFRWRGRREALVRVSMPLVEGLDASSGAHIQAAGLAGGAVSLEASSGAAIDVAGACASFSAEASSGANIDAGALRCERGSVSASSGASAHVYATGRLDVDASSGGDVVAFGDPGIGDISLSSGGSLRRR